MPVVTGIIQAARIAYIGYKVSKIVYKGVKQTTPVAKWIYRHPKVAKYGTIGATAAPVIYDLLNIDYSAIQNQKGPAPGKPGKTRDYMVKTRGRFGYTGYSNRYRNKRCYGRRRSTYR